MQATVFYAFSFHSPYSALANTQVDELVSRAGYTLAPLPLVPQAAPPELQEVQGLVHAFKADSMAGLYDHNTMMEPAKRLTIHKTGTSGRRVPRHVAE